MSDIADWADLMTDSVTVEKFVSRDTHGVATFAPNPKVYAARVNYANHYVRDASGELVVATGYAIMACTDPISPKDRFTLTDGTTRPNILAVNAETDEAGPLYTRVDWN